MATCTAAAQHVLSRGFTASPSRRSTAKVEFAKPFLRGTGALKQTATLRIVADRSSLDVQAFKFMKKLGLKKPDFLPDFGLEKRMAVLERFYKSLDRSTYEDLLADSFFVKEQGGSKTYSKADWISFLVDRIKPAIPDFTWGMATDGKKDDDGFCIVVVQATGHHTGKPFEMPGFPPVEATGKRFKLGEETHKVKVEDGKVQEIYILKSEGAGPRGLYKALGGSVPK